MFMVALFITAPSWEQVKFLLLLQKRMHYWYMLQPGWILKCFAKWKKPGNLLLFSRSVASDSLRPHGLQYARLPCPPLSPGVYSNSCPLSWWCHPAISASAAPSPPALSLSRPWSPAHGHMCTHRHTHAHRRRTKARPGGSLFRPSTLIIPGTYQLFL